MRYFFFFLSLICLSYCAAAQTVEECHKLIVDEWVSQQDSLYVLLISESNIMEYYNQVQTDEYTFTLSTKSCDSSFTNKKSNVEDIYLQKTDLKGLFTYCYILWGVNEKNLSLGYTLRPQPMVFNRRSY